MEGSMDRRWRYGLKVVLYVTLVVAAYCAGYVQRAGEVRQLKETVDTLSAKNAELFLELVEVESRAARGR
jgi:hypothetical protein